MDSELEKAGLERRGNFTYALAMGISSRLGTEVVANPDEVHPEDDDTGAFFFVRTPEFDRFEVTVWPVGPQTSGELFEFTHDQAVSTECLFSFGAERITYEHDENFVNTAIRFPSMKQLSEWLVMTQMGMYAEILSSTVLDQQVTITVQFPA